LPIYLGVITENGPLRTTAMLFRKTNLNSLKAELNSICHLLALLGAHLILYVSRIRVKFLLCATGMSSMDLKCDIYRVNTKTLLDFK
jgi:hypothetical protein